VIAVWEPDGTVMNNWIEQAELRWRALEPLGAEIDVNLSEPLGAMQEKTMVDLLWDRGLILARGQSLTMDRQREICGLFGPILLREGEIGIMSNDGGEHTTTELSWHSDAAYTEAPFDALSLHALDVVQDASSTRFVAVDRALDTLPADLRDRLEGRRVEMISPGFEALARRTCDTRDPSAMKRGEMSAIYRNPHNGRNGLWVSELQTARVLGMEWEDSRELLRAVFDHLYRPEHIFEHRWRTGDILIWDNIALQHMRSSLENCGRRVLQRVIVGSEGVAPHVQERP
jgi:taurine dioxygenase